MVYSEVEEKSSRIIGIIIGEKSGKSMLMVRLTWLNSKMMASVKRLARISQWLRSMIKFNMSFLTKNLKMLLITRK